MGPALGRILPLEVVEPQLKLAESKKENSLALMTGTSRDAASLRHSSVQELEIFSFSLSLPFPQLSHQWVLQANFFQVVKESSHQ